MKCCLCGKNGNMDDLCQEIDHRYMIPKPYIYHTKCLKNVICNYEHFDLDIKEKAILIESLRKRRLDAECYRETKVNDRLRSLRSIYCDER